MTETKYTTPHSSTFDFSTIYDIFLILKIYILGSKSINILHNAFSVVFFHNYVNISI